MVPPGWLFGELIKFDTGLPAEAFRVLLDYFAVLSMPLRVSRL
jgi:hypothetical protein